jgi:hypothetical protein
MEHRNCLESIEGYRTNGGISFKLFSGSVLVLMSSVLISSIHR